MSSNRTNFRLIGAFAMLALLVLAASCTGFFVNPTLSSIAVGPASPTIQTGTTDNTVQMIIDDGVQIVLDESVEFHGILLLAVRKYLIEIIYLFKIQKAAAARVPGAATYESSGR